MTYIGDADSPHRSPLFVYGAVGLLAGAVIALQIAIMRIFQIGSWAHFGSLVVSLAMLGFGLTSAVMCVGRPFFERHWRATAAWSLILMGPLAVAANLIAQQIPFNAIFLVSDPQQKWRLTANFLLYLLPFLAGATFLGTVFLRAATGFNRIYFADLAGSGLCGLVVLGAMYLAWPEDLVVAPLLLWAGAGLLWFLGIGGHRSLALFAVAVVAALVAHLWLPSAFGVTKLATSDYKGVAYARKFPDARRVYARNTPFGFIEVYASSYLHFAPGLSDNAAFNLKEMPRNAYLGLYVDGEGPAGIIRDLPAAQTDYFRFLPMFYPFVIKANPSTFVVQFGGGLSTTVALSKSRHVTVAEGNPAILTAFSTDPTLRTFTGDLIHKPGLDVIPYEGRLFLAKTHERYDVIDLSLADSAGLSSPGGFPIVEKFAYTQEAFESYMRALAPGGILSVTIWNKEEPPKSILKLYATMGAAARDFDAARLSRSFFVVSTYLSTATVLYKNGGFTDAEITALRRHSQSMSFDEIYYPSYAPDISGADKIFTDYSAQLFGTSGSTAGGNGASGDGADPGPDADAAAPGVLPATSLGRIAWQAIVKNKWDEISRRYIFDVRPLTNDRPYFAAYIKPQDLAKITDRLELVQDEWGYLLLWATLFIAAIAASTLIAIPVIFGWRSVFSRTPGKFLTIVYFACLGLGYIMIEVGMIAEFVLALANATISASIMITGMLVFSGLGSFVSERILPRTRTFMPLVFIGIAGLLVTYGLFLHIPLDAIGTYPYGLRLLLSFLLVFPPAFLMGFPMPTAMATLARLRKDTMFLWAWGINGCFSVIGAAIVPIVATAFGLSSVLFIGAGAYLLALPAFFAVLMPMRDAAPAWRQRRSIRARQIA
jgi:type IV secretory pathway TrbD component